VIFSLLNVRKKTAASLAGISIAALCLWGLSMWQDISLAQLMQTGLAVLAMLLTIMAAALLLIAAAKLLLWLLGKGRSGQSEPPAEPGAADNGVGDTTLDSSPEEKSPPKASSRGKMTRHKADS
jgi:hypothetical protein